MRKLELSNIGYVILFIIVVLIMTQRPAHAQDVSSAVTSCYTRTDAGAVFTFSNIPDEWLDGLGWYSIGDAVTLDGHTLTVTGLQFDGGYSYAIVGRGDYSENVQADTDSTPLCGGIQAAPVQTTPIAPVALNNSIPAAVVSTGRTCVVKYLEHANIVIVCNE